MRIFKHKGLFLKDSPVHGYGLYTDVKILFGELIEECPVSTQRFPLEVDKYQNPFLMPYPSLKEKESLWTTNGYCSHLNHSTKHNVIWSIDQDKMIASFVACQNILPGEELFINYHLEM